MHGVGVTPGCHNRRMAMTAIKVRHLSVVRAEPVYTGDHREPEPPALDEPQFWRPPIPPEPEAHERWVACERPDARLRYGAYLCDCATCWAVLARMVREHRRPGLTVIVVTEADRIVTSARELLTQHELGDGYQGLLWVTNDRVRHVYVGKGATHETSSEGQHHWRVRAAREGRYPPRPRLERDDAAVSRHPASTAPTVELSLRLPRSLDRRAAGGRGRRRARSRDVDRRSAARVDRRRRGRLGGLTHGDGSRVAC